MAPGLPARLLQRIVLKDNGLTQALQSVRRARRISINKNLTLNSVGITPAWHDWQYLALTEKGR